MLSASSPQRARRIERINAEYERRQLIGFPVTLGGVEETLQVARDVDKTNWLTVYGICLEGAAIDLGDVPDLIFLQTTSNRKYYMSFNEAATIIRALRQWGLDAWANWNRLKDAARDPAQTPTSEALEALDLNEGWP